jgi:hypothetical protein
MIGGFFGFGGEELFVLGRTPKKAETINHK